MDLLKRFKQGEPDAFETLFRQFQAEVYGWIVQIVRDSGIAEDLTIETFWRIHQARARFDTKASFGPWARRIARNLAIDYIRSQRHEQELSEQSLSIEAADSALRREAHEKLERAFRQLPAKLQTTAALALVDERPYQEIAELLGASVGTVRTRVFRAIRQLRKQLEDMGVQR
jgi:RNA polymerase sigma-70 factor, ECF subfamily